jgi:MFS family permease
MNPPTTSVAASTKLLNWLALPADDLLREAGYRRLWLSILVSGFGAQLSALALPLAAVSLLQATPAQMGLLGAIGAMPFVLFLLPSGVWLDRVSKLPVYVAGEAVLALALAAVPLAWAFDRLGMALIYLVAFVGGCVAATSGTAAQIVLTQIVGRGRLVEAHGKNALANSAAQILGPGAAGALIRLAGTPLTLLVNAALLVVSLLTLRRLRPVEAARGAAPANFWGDMKEGIRFVAGNRLLISMAAVVGLWQICQTAAMVAQVLFATRELGLQDYQLGLCYGGSGLGTVVASAMGHRLSQRIGPGPSLILGFAISGLGWLQLAGAPSGTWGVMAFVLMLLCFSSGTVLIFTNMLALRQAITPAPLLARMTSTMRWLTLLPAAPGALLGGYLGEQFGVRHAIGFGGGGAILLALLAWRCTVIRGVTSLPEQQAGATSASQPGS